MVAHPKITFFLLLFLSGSIAYGQRTSVTEDVWRKGMEAREEGHVARALQFWEHAVKRGLNPDPRIGFSYIEAATELGLRDRYTKASAIYEWGLSGCTKRFKEDLEQEIERLRPIVEAEMFEQWEQELQNNPATLCERVNAFWEMIDPTASTAYNERLIEHWERIAYSRDHFNRGTSSIYDADERALIYIKLGDPDYIKKGTLHFNSALVRAWAQDGIEYQASTNTSLTNPLTDAGGAGDSASSVARRQQYQSQIAFKEFIAESILREARLLHRYPYYEVWIYRNLLPEARDNVIYIFGEDGDTGEFRMQQSLEEMIPNSAFRKDPTNRTQITPGLMLQMLFYEQTSIADDYFADAYRELESNLFAMNSFNPHISLSVESQKASQLRFLQYKAPREKSTYMETLPNIDLNVYQYRMLDKSNRPYLATFVKSQPQEAFFFDQFKSNRYGNAGYQLYHYARVEGAKPNDLLEQSEAAEIYHEGAGNVDEMQKSSAYFKIPNTVEGNRQIFSAELHDLRRDSTQVGKTVFTKNIRGIGKIEVQQPEPLSVSPARLEVSEIMLGVDEGEEALGDRGPTSFNVIHNNVIPADKNLMMHFEVYHLPASAQDPARFEVEYQVIKRNRNVLQRLFGGSSEKVRLTLNFETFDAFHKTDLEVSTASFEPGAYRLSLAITEPQTDQTIVREVDFEIRE